MKVASPDGDDPNFFLNLLMAEQLLKGIVQRSNEYPQGVINNCSRTLQKKIILNTWKDVIVEEMK